MTRLSASALIVVVVVAAAPPKVKDGLIARIGDVDGFGFGAAEDLKAANRKPANAGGHPVLGSGDFLPDINQDGLTQVDGGDDFDLRDQGEAADIGNAFGAGVFEKGGTTGSKFTDISLSTSYGRSAAAGWVQVRDESSGRLGSGKGGALPRPTSANPSIQPGFAFRFGMTKAELPDRTPIFFNMVFGDYDVSPAKIQITRADGTKKTIDVKTHDRAEDGLIQAATATLKFEDVFQDDGQSWKCSIAVDFLAPQEPYTAFDYVELSTAALVRAPQQESANQGRMVQGRPANGQRQGQVIPPIKPRAGQRGSADDSSPAPAKQAEQFKALQGRWSIYAQTNNGYVNTVAELQEQRWSIERIGNRFIVRKGDEPRNEGVWTIDATKDPMEMKIVFKDGRISNSLCKWDGDTLVMCAGEVKPDRFESLPGQRRILSRSRRIDP